MHKLIIRCKYDPLAKMPESEVELDEDYNESQAELRALRWLMYRPHDLVMLVEIETAVCKHCGTPIEEKVGWVKHRWVHQGGYYACLPNGETQAEPKEDG